MLFARYSKSTVFLGSPKGTIATLTKFKLTITNAEADSGFWNRMVPLLERSEFVESMTRCAIFADCTCLLIIEDKDWENDCFKRLSKRRGFLASNRWRFGLTNGSKCRKRCIDGSAQCLSVKGRWPIPTTQKFMKNGVIDWNFRSVSQLSKRRLLHEGPSIRIRRSSIYSVAQRYGFRLRLRLLLSKPFALAQEWRFQTRHKRATL